MADNIRSGRDGIPHLCASDVWSVLGAAGRRLAIRFWLRDWNCPHSCGDCASLLLPQEKKERVNSTNSDYFGKLGSFHEPSFCGPRTTSLDNGGYPRHRKGGRRSSTDHESERYGENGGKRILQRGNCSEQGLSSQG